MVCKSIVHFNYQNSVLDTLNDQQNFVLQMVLCLGRKRSNKMLTSNNKHVSDTKGSFIKDTLYRRPELTDPADNMLVDPQVLWQGYRPVTYFSFKKKIGFSSFYRKSRKLTYSVGFVSGVRYSDIPLWRIIWSLSRQVTSLQFHQSQWDR